MAASDLYRNANVLFDDGMWGRIPDRKISSLFLADSFSLSLCIAQAT